MPVGKLTIVVLRALYRREQPDLFIKSDRIGVYAQLLCDLPSRIKRICCLFEERPWLRGGFGRDILHHLPNLTPESSANSGEYTKIRPLNLIGDVQLELASLNLCKLGQPAAVDPFPAHSRF
ncbi:hypothetical protein D3C75_839000 [compost metagenome]